MPLTTAFISSTAKASKDFIVNNWKGILIVIVLVIVGWKYYSLNKQVSNLTTQNDTLATKNVQLTVDNKQLADIAGVTKDAATQIKDLSTELDTKFANLGNTIKQQQVETAKKISDLKNAPAPRSDKESVDYIIQGASELRSTK